MKGPGIPEKPTATIRSLNPHLFGPKVAPAAIVDPEVRRKWELKDARLEEALAQECLSHLRREFEGQYHVIRANPRRRSTIGPGVQDLTIFLPQGVLLVELKSSTGRLDPEQRAHHELMQKLGWFVHVVRSYDHFVELVRIGFGLSTNPPTEPTK